MSTNTDKRAFISYARTHQAFVRRLADDLKEQGVSIWLDVDDIAAGENWANAIDEGLNACDLMLLIVSTASMESKNVADEWQYYHDEQKPIIPILLETSRLHFQLRRLNYVDFTQGYTKSFRQLEKHLVDKGFQVKTTEDTFLQQNLDFATEGMININTAIEQIHTLLRAMNVNPTEAKIMSPTGHGWSFQFGSALIEVYLAEQNDSYYLQVLSPLVRFPEGNLQALFQYLLELNLSLTGASMGTYQDVVYLYTELDLTIVNLDAFNIVIRRVAEYANDLDYKLIERFNCQLYLG